MGISHIKYDMIISAITNGITKVFAILMDPSLKPLLLWKIKYDDDGDHDDDNDGDLYIIGAV